MRRSRLLAAHACALLAACGGGGGGEGEKPVVHAAPLLSLVAPANGATLSGTVAVQVRATGDGTDVATLRFDAPAALAGATPVLDAGTHSATITGTVEALGLPDGPLTVTATAVDASGRTTTASFAFVVSASARTVNLDPSLATFRDEVGMSVQSGASGPLVPSVYAYAGSALSVVSGTTVRRAATRVGWSMGPVRNPAPTPEELETTNGLNVPTMRFLVSQPAGAAALASARATVAVGCTGCAAEPVTVDLWPSSWRPAGATAFLLPLSADLVPALGQLPTGQADVTVNVVVRDALGREAQGGPWTIRFVVVAPPLVVVDDPAYRAGPAMWTVKDFPRDGAYYKNTWNPVLFEPYGGLRLARVVVFNPAPVPVAVGVTLVSPSWEFAEAWTVETASRVETCIMPCPSNQGARYGASGDLTCTTPEWAAEPPPSLGCRAASQALVAGALVFSRTSYAAAPTTPSGRYLVPAAANGAAGALELYVIRPVLPRPDTCPPLTTYTDPYGEVAGGWSTPAGSYLINTAYTAGLGCSSGVYTRWDGKSWRRMLTGTHEQYGGTLQLEARGLSASGDELGAAVPLWSLDLAGKSFDR